MKWVIGLAVALLLVGFVNAGSIEGLDYKDRTCIFGFCDTNRQVDDYDVVIDANTLDGSTKGEILSDAYGYSDLGDATVKSYCDDSDDVGGGISEPHALKLIDAFFAKVRLVFAPMQTRDDARMLLLWAEDNGFSAEYYELKCAKVYGVCGRTECFPNGVCLRG